MNKTALRTDEIHLTHKSNSSQKSVINIISESPLGLNTPLHVKQYIIDDKFKMIVENDELIIQKKISGTFRNYFILS